MPSVLFVCTANQFRSPLAAHYFLEDLESSGEAAGWVVESAGTWIEAGGGVSQPVLREAGKLGLSLEGHEPRMLDGALIGKFDLVLVMESGQKEAIRAEFPEARQKVIMLSEMAQGFAYDVPDPGKDSRHSFESVGREVQAMVRKAFPAIVRLVHERAQ